MEVAEGARQVPQSRVERVLKVIDAINTKVAWVVSLLFIPIMLLTVIEVIARYFFKSPTIFVWDTNTMIFALVVIFSAGYTLLHDQHVRIDALTVHLPSKTQIALDTFGMLLVIFVAVVFMWQGAEAGWESFMGKETFASRWNPPVYPIKMLLPLGGFLLLIQGIAKLTRNVVILLSVKK